MRYLSLIALLILIGCKKQQPEPQNNPQPTPTPITVPTKTVTVYSKAYAGNGTIIINWGAGQDTTYNYSITQYLTRVIQADSISLNFYCKACSSCSFGQNDVTVTVNSVIVKYYTGDWGNTKRWVKI